MTQSEERKLLFFTHLTQFLTLTISTANLIDFILINFNHVKEFRKWQRDKNQDYFLNNFFGFIHSYMPGERTIKTMLTVSDFNQY